MVNVVIAQFEEYDRKIFWALLALCIGALFLYAYFVSISIVSVVARKDAERELGRATARVAILESSYATLDREIDLTLAHTRGFVDISAPRYISADGEYGRYPHTAAAIR